MDSVSKLISMSAAEIQRRKASITKQDLLDVLVHLKNQPESHETLKKDDIISTIESKINETMKSHRSTISSLFNDHIELKRKYDDLEKNFLTLAARMDDCVSEITEELQQRMKKNE